MISIITQNSVEVLFLAFTALTTGFVVFASGVFQRIMDDSDEATFKRLLGDMTKNALKSPFVIGLSMATLLGMVPYFYLFRLSNPWFSAGLALWIVTSVVSKVTRLPIYKRVADLKSTDSAHLREERKKLHQASNLTAALSLATVVLMVIGLL